MPTNLKSIVSTLQAYFQTYSKPITLFIAAIAMICNMAMVVPIYTTYKSNYVDLSWELDLMSKLEQGELLGRDTAFTYGPVAQLVYDSSKLVRPDASVINRIAISHWFIRIFVVILLLGCIYTIPNLNWRSSLFIFVCFALFINVPSFARPFLTLQVVVLFSLTLSITDTKRRTIYCIAAGLLCFAGQLFTFDVGVFAILAVCGFLVICSLFWLFRTRIEILPGIQFSTLFSSGAIFGGTVLIANLLLCLFFSLTSSNYAFFDYIYYNIEIASSYNYIMGVPWSLDRLLGLTILAIYLFCLIAFIREYRSISIERRYIYIGLFVLSIVQFKGAIVRSDASKILLSLTPVIFLFLLLAFDDIKGKTLIFYARTLLVILALLWPLDTAIIGLDKLVPSINKPGIFAEQIRKIRNYNLPSEAIIPEGIAGNLNDNSYLLNFPYENLFAIALERKSVTPILQPYAANSFELQKYYTDKMERSRNNTEIIYSLDGVSVFEIDQIQHITRLPHIFEYIYSNFELKYDTAFEGGHVILKPRSEATTIKTTPIEFTTSSNEDGSLVASFLEPTTCSALKLSVEISYPITAALGRPTTLSTRVFFKDKELIHRRIPALELDKEFSTYLYVGDPRLFYHIFTPDQPKGFAYQIDSLVIGKVEFGLFDVHPDKVSLNKLECVNFTPGKIENTQPDLDADVGPILAGAPVRQEFIGGQDKLAGIYVEIATLGRVNTAPIIFQLQRIDAAGIETTVAESRYDMKDFMDKARFLFSFPAQDESEGQRYALVVDVPEGKPQNSITLLRQRGDVYTKGGLSRGTDKMLGDLYFQLLYLE